MELIGHWVRHHLAPTAASGAEPESVAAGDALAEIRRTLPGIGYLLTSKGIRRATSPVDRVLARSASKTEALVQIARSERDELGEELRLLVVCDHERATATIPSGLTGVLDRRAGSARLALGSLASELPDLAPLLMTAATVAGGAETLARLIVFCEEADPGLDLIAVPDESDEFLVLQANPGSAGWHSRRWVPLVTRFFEEGHTRALIGTRGLLGEGWDARSVTSLVDLTSATTATSVVQTRGRALRTDPQRQDKVATNWSVTCVSNEHPGGAADWDRLVRKHRGFFATDHNGAIVDGVAHLSDELSPFAPPPVESFATLNSAMMRRVSERADIAASWQVGTPYLDAVLPVLRVHPESEPRATEVSVPGAQPPVRRLGDVAPLWRVSPWLAVPLTSGLLVTPALALAGASTSRVIGVALLTILAMLAVQLGVTARRGRSAYLTAGARPSVAALAGAVADALHEVDREVDADPRGHEGPPSDTSSAVTVDIDADGTHRCRLDSADPQAGRRFTVALDELLSPMARPRYVISRSTTGPDASLVDGLLAAFGRVRPTGEVWHPVPTEFGRNRATAEIFAGAFDRHVGGSRIEYTGSPEGQVIVALHRGLDPFDATTVTRLHWR